MAIETEMINIGKKAQRAAFILKNASTNSKNKALIRMANELEKQTEKIISANKKDTENAKKINLEQAKVDRLVLNPDKIRKIAEGLREIAAQPDPINEIISMWRRPNGMDVGLIRVPLGVIGIVYESRPNVTADSTGLALKAGNAIILRGGSEAINSNVVITDILHEAAVKEGLPENCVQIIKDTNREYVGEIIKDTNREYIGEMLF